MVRSVCRAPCRMPFNVGCIASANRPDRHFRWRLLPAGGSTLRFCSQFSDVEEGDLLSVVKELIAAQLVVEETDDRFAFRHALSREAVYSDLLGRERRGLHTDVLAALEQTEAPALEELSYHAYSAGVWEKTLTYAAHAGLRAVSMHAPRAAIEHFGRAMDAAEKLGQSPPPEVLRGRAEADHNLGDFESARAGYEAALVAATASGDQHMAWQTLVDLKSAVVGSRLCDCGRVC